jgi:hypothetical protein
MKKNFTIIVLICFSILSCNKIIDAADSFGKDTTKIEDLKTVTVNEEYLISVPAYMTELKTLNDDASFKYANIFKDVYTIVIDESKQEFIDTFEELEMYDATKTALENYTDFQLKTFQENIENLTFEKIPSKKSTLNQYKFKGKIEGLDIYYLIGFFEGDKNMYLLMSWAQKNKFNKYEDTFKMVHNSFKLLKYFELYQNTYIRRNIKNN